MFWDDFKRLLDMLLSAEQGTDAASQAYRATLHDIDDLLQDSGVAFATLTEAIAWLHQQMARERQSLLLARDDPDERTDLAEHEGRLRAYRLFIMRLEAEEEG